MQNQYLDQILAGNTHVFKYLVKEYKDMVFAVAFRIVKNTQDAEEIAQDAFIKAYQNLAGFDRKAKFSTWLYKIVFNLALNKKRQFKYVETGYEYINESEMADETNESLQLLKSDEQKKYINLAINTLSEDEALILTLFYLAENDIKEICVITSWSESNVKIKLHRARKNLFGALNNLLKKEVRALY